MASGLSAVTTKDIVCPANTLLIMMQVVALPKISQDENGNANKQQRIANLCILAFFPSAHGSTFVK